MDTAEGHRATKVADQLRLIVLGAIVGVLAGCSSALFLVALDWATATRTEHPGLVWLLPVAGLAVGAVYHYRAGPAAAGTRLILDEIHEPKAWVPRRLALFVGGGTIVTHLFGGSAGREGTALQMAGSLADGFSRAVRLRPAYRRVLLVAALAGGFGAVFGVPIAGWVFALEVRSVGRLRYDAIGAALTASVVGDRVVRALNVHHTVYPRIGAVALDAGLIGKVVVAGALCGLTGVVFIFAVHQVRRLLAPVWPPLRTLVGGIVVIVLTLAVGTRDYLGLSLPLMTEAMAGGTRLVAGAFALKLVFTVVTLGAGFPGGEVTPLFVIGATLGATLGALLGAPVPVLAAVGFVAVFAGAANVPLACTIMAVELFGADVAVLAAVGCAAASVCSSHQGIYGSRRTDPGRVRGRRATT